MIHKITKKRKTENGYEEVYLKTITEQVFDENTSALLSDKLDEIEINSKRTLDISPINLNSEVENTLSKDNYESIVAQDLVDSSITTASNNVNDIITELENNVDNGKNLGRLMGLSNESSFFNMKEEYEGIFDNINQSLTDKGLVISDGNLTNLPTHILRLPQQLTSSKFNTINETVNFTPFIKTITFNNPIEINDVVSSVLKYDTATNTYILATTSSYDWTYNEATKTLTYTIKQTGDYKFNWID